MILPLMLAILPGQATSSEAGFHAGAFIGPRIGTELFGHNGWMDMGVQVGYSDLFLRATISPSMSESGPDRIQMAPGQKKPETGGTLASWTVGKQWRNEKGRWFALGAGWGEGEADTILTSREDRRFVDLDSTGRLVDPLPCRAFPFGCDVEGWAWPVKRTKEGPVVFGEVGWSRSGGAVSMKVEYFLAPHFSLTIWARLP